MGLLQACTGIWERCMAGNPACILRTKVHLTQEAFSRTGVKGTRADMLVQNKVLPGTHSPGRWERKLTGSRPRAADSGPQYLGHRAPKCGMCVTRKNLTEAHLSTAWFLLLPLRFPFCHPPPKRTLIFWRNVANSQERVTWGIVGTVMPSTLGSPNRSGLNYPHHFHRPKQVWLFFLIRVKYAWNIHFNHFWLCNC